VDPTVSSFADDNNWHPHPVSRHLRRRPAEGGRTGGGRRREDPRCPARRYSRRWSQACWRAGHPGAAGDHQGATLAVARAGPPRPRHTCGPTRSQAMWSSLRRPQTLRGRRQHGSHGVLRADRSRHPDSSGQAAVTLVHGVSEATRWPGSAQRRSRSWPARIVATGRSGSRAGQTGRRHGNGFCACWASSRRPHRATGPVSGLGRCRTPTVFASPRRVLSTIPMRP